MMADVANLTQTTASAPMLSALSTILEVAMLLDSLIISV